MSHKTRNTEKKILGLTIGDLTGKQSVRATFKLPGQIIDLLSVVAGQLGIKQKSLFDRLIEDVEVLKQLAEEVRRYPSNRNNRRQKTFVISRKSLTSLDYIAKQQHIGRDTLVEASIRRLLPVIELELKRHEDRKIVLKDMKNYLDQGEKLMRNAKELLGPDDRAYTLIKHQVELCRRNVETVKCIVGKGKPMEKW